MNIRQLKCDVRDRLQSRLGGKVKAHTKQGLIDLLTETELIEVWASDRWLDGVGHVLAKSHKYPNHTKRLHLFGPDDSILEPIVESCEDWNIRVTFEKVERLKGKGDRKAIV